MEKIARVERENNTRIKFYKLAISFNQHNRNAWEGLVQTYFAVNRNDEANQTLNRMEEIFAADDSDLKKAVEAFGPLTDRLKLKEGRLEFTYRSRCGDINAMQAEMKQMAASLRQVKRLNSVSITADNGKLSVMQEY